MYFFIVTVPLLIIGLPMLAIGAVVVGAWNLYRHGELRLDQTMRSLGFGGLLAVGFVSGSLMGLALMAYQDWQQDRVDATEICAVHRVVGASLADEITDREDLAYHLGKRAGCTGNSWDSGPSAADYDKYERWLREDR